VVPASDPSNDTKQEVRVSQNAALQLFCPVEDDVDLIAHRRRLVAHRHHDEPLAVRMDVERRRVAGKPKSLM
jgi:hypothetical protein